MKLGEALVKAGLITGRQLKEALERQVVFGGRIDTNLVELRFIDDEKLAIFLGKFLKLPSVSPDMVNSIPGYVIQTLGRETVEKYKVLPFKLERHKLHVAMLNPKDVKVIDDLRFLTGFEIIPYVITELRLLNAFEKYYGIRKELRYISIKDRFGTDTEIEDADIERQESKFEQVKDTGEQTENLLRDKIKSTALEVNDTREMTGLIGALLSNAFYTAKLFYAQQDKTFTDNEIEDEIIKNWARISKKILNSEGDSL